MKKTLATAAVATFLLSGCDLEKPATDAAGGSSSSDSSQAGSKYTVAQQNAIRSAKSYVSLSGFSRRGLIQQLSSKAGEGYRRKDAVFAVNHIKVDYKKEAVESAKGYLEMTGMSRSGLIQQLSSSAGEKFTRAQAEYAADQVGLK